MMVCSITNLFRILIIRRFMKKLFYDKNIDFKVEIFIYGMFFIINTVSYLIFHLPIINLLTNLMGLLLITLLYTKVLSEIFLFITLVYIVNMGCDFVAISLFVDYKIGKEFNQFYVIVTVLLLLISELVVEKIMTVRKNTELEFSHSLALSIVPLCSIILLFFLQFDNIHNNQMLVLVGIGFLIINFFVFYLYNEIEGSYIEKHEKELLKQRVAIYANQLDVILQSENNIRSLQHDMKHHLNELNILAKKIDAVQIITYLKAMDEFIINPDEVAASGNKDIDSILNYLIQKARKNLKEVNVSLRIPEKIAHSFDIIIILGNLLENAIEAALKSEEKKLDISIQLKKSILSVDVLNSYTGVIIEKDKKLQTSKREREYHGIGLENVRKIVDKYNGLMEYSYEDGIFHTNLILYMSDFK